MFLRQAQGFRHSNKDDNKDANIDMFKFKESGIKVPMPNIDISESEIPGWDNVNIVKSEVAEKKKTDAMKTEDQLQLIKALDDLKQLELAYQKNSEELALEKKQHAKTIEDNNKLREGITLQSEAIETLKKNIEEITKQKEEASKSADENITLLKTQDDFIVDLRRRIEGLESTRDRLAQATKELSRKNELLQKTVDDSKKQLSSLHGELEQNKKSMQDEIHKKNSELQKKDEQLERARTRIFKLESIKNNSQSVLYPTRKKEQEEKNTRRHGRDADSKSIIMYR